MARKTDVRYVSFYTAGSTAYKFDTAPLAQPKKKVRLPKPRRQKKIVIPVDPVAIGGIVLASILLVMMVVGLFQFAAVYHQANQMQAYVERLEAKNEELDARYHAGFDPEEIRQIATAMGMVPAEEVNRIEITVTQPETAQTPTGVGAFWEFLKGLFA